MYIFTITKWKKKLAAVVISLCFLIGLGLGLNWYLGPEDVPVGDLQNDVMSKPVEVQGQPSQTKEENKQEEENEGDNEDEGEEEKEDENTENSEES